MKNKIKHIIFILIFIFIYSKILCYASTSNNILIIAGDNNYPPYEYVDDSGIYKGFNVDIMNALSVELGIDIQFSPLNWHNAINLLENEKIDAIQGMNKTPEREKTYTFTEKTSTNSQSIFVSIDENHIHELSDLSGKRVSYQIGDTSENILKNIPNIILVPKSNQLLALNSLVNNEVDAFVGTKLTALYNLQKSNNQEKLKIVGEPISSLDYCIAVKKGNTKTLNLLNSGLNSIKENGTYDKIYRKWFGQKIIDEKAIIKKYTHHIITMLLTSLTIFVLILFWNYKLRKEVNLRTNELEKSNEVLKFQKEKLKNLAYYDCLTGLPNRIYLFDKLSKIIETNEDTNLKLAVFFLDLDRFKNINDTLGHNIGDELICLVAKRLKRLLNSNQIITRIGGDEFIILTDNFTKQKDIYCLADKIINEFNKSFNINNHEIYITISIGISFFPECGTSIQELIRKSDIAMYKAKELGKNTYYFYSPNSTKEETDSLQLVTDLRHALLKKSFELYYQPKISLKTGTLDGVEALIRWNHPSYGFISPAKFIPIAEECGLIVPIGKWVLETACKQIHYWQHEYSANLSVSVNLSSQQFQHSSLLDDIENIIENTQIDTKYLKLEITERTALIDVENTIKTINKLKQLGITFSLDDFGTGFSNLKALEKIDIDELKIDKSYLDDIKTNTKSKAIISAIIKMAHNLNLNVVTEGVENKEQLEFLQQSNCDTVQGFYFSKPISSDKFTLKYILNNNV